MTKINMSIMSESENLVSGLLEGVSQADNGRHITTSSVLDIYDVELTTDQPLILNRVTGQTMKQWIWADNPCGQDGMYKYVTLQCTDGSSVHESVGSLVLLHFVGPQPPDHVLEHKDGDNCNNTLTNVAWIDKSSQVFRQHAPTHADAEDEVKGRPLTAVSHATGEVRRFPNASLAWNQMKKEQPDKTSGVTYVNGLASSNGRGLEHTWSYTPPTVEGERVLALEWRQVPPEAVGDNETVQCSIEGHVRFNTVAPTLGRKMGDYLGTCINKKTKLIHRLVAAAWYGPRGRSFQVDHADGDLLHNAPSNLGWVSVSENKGRSDYQGRAIDQVHPSTGAVVRTYETYMHAVRATGITEGIGQAISSGEAAEKKMREARERNKPSKADPCKHVLKAGGWHWRCSIVYRFSANGDVLETAA